MRTLLTFLAAVITVATADVHPLRPRDLVSFHRLSSPVPSPDGTHALFTSSRYIPDENETKRSLWLLQLEDDEVVELSTNATSEPFWISDIVLGGVLDGQVWIGDISAHLGDINAVKTKPEFTKLTDFPVDIANVKFHRNSSTMAFTAEVYDDGGLEEAKRRKENEEKRFDSAVVYDQLFVRHWDKFTHPEKRNNLFVVKLKVDGSSVTIDGEARNVMAGEGLETPVPPFGDTTNFAFSPDGKEIAFSSRVPKHSAAWNTNLDIYIVPTDGSSKPVSISRKNKGADTFPVYSPDGKYLAWLQMATPQHEADKNRVILYDRSSGTTSYLTKKWDRSAESLVWTSDSTHLILTAQDRGHVKIFSLKISSHKIKTLVDKHTNGGLSIVGDTLFFEQNSVTAPAEIFTLGLNGDGEVSQRTKFNEGLLMKTLMSDPEEFWFDGAGGDKVMGWLFKPTTYTANRRYPLAFLIHGGPEGAWNDGWSYRWNPQVFTGAGYVVITINFHGSTGYGTDFTKSIIKHWGGRPYKDLMKGLDHALATYTFIDPNRLTALGASYGGYMINWLNGHTNRFRCLVNHDGMFSTHSTYYSTDELWFPETEFGSPPYVDSYYYDKYDPSKYVKKWRTPTLVIHGEKDYRLGVAEGLSTFTALQRNGVPSRLVWFPDEGHWVLKGGNSLRWYGEVLGWLDEWVGKGGKKVEGEEDEVEKKEGGMLVVQNGEDIIVDL